MKYGLIICPKCGMARGVEAEKKTTTCQCGREIELKRMKLKFLTDSPLELADSVAQANAALRGGGQLPPEKKPNRKDPFFVIAERAKPVKDPIERMRIIAKGLTDLRGDFGIEDVRKVVSVLGKDSAEDIIARLKEHNLIYESGAGAYRSI
jgi:hypothetical protein